MEYTVSFENPLNHFVDISFTCSTGDKRSLDLRLPAWRPGRYERANYAQNIRAFEARSLSGERLNHKKVSGNRWRVYTENNPEVKVCYQYYANQLDAGGSMLDDQQLYLNFINCMLYAKHELLNPCTVNLSLARKFKIACGLERPHPFQLYARSYYQLVDSPMIASTRLTRWRFQLNGTKINLWFMGSQRLNKNKVIKAFKHFIAEQITTMGEFPEDDYHFIFQVPLTKVYHGVEHANSTVIALGPGSELHKSRYQDFLGISSHEFFHSWNIIKIRPKELVPYDFQQEVYFDTGFIAEGITTYYGDLFLVRSGVFDLKQYFKELNTLLKRHFENEGRHYASLVDSSRDLWVDGYKQSAPGRKVSIYTKGALVSLMLDLTLRKLTGHEKSLDDVMRRLWQEYGKKFRGYSLKDFQAVCEQVAGQSLNMFFEDYVSGTVPLEAPLALLLESIGCKLCPVPSRQLSKKHFGLRTTKQGQELTVLQITPGSPAYDKMSTGDVIVSVNGKKPKHKLNALIHDSHLLKLVINRQGRKVKITLPRTRDRFFTQHRIEKMKRTTKDQNEGFKKWLGIPFRR